MLIVLVSAPVFQTYLAASLDARLTLASAQKVVGPLAVIAGLGGSGLTTTFILAEGVDKHPLSSLAESV